MEQREFEPVAAVAVTKVLPVLEWREPWWRRVVARVMGANDGRA